MFTDEALFSVEAPSVGKTERKKKKTQGARGTMGRAKLAEQGLLPRFLPSQHSLCTLNSLLPSLCSLFFSPFPISLPENKRVLCEGESRRSKAIEKSLQASVQWFQFQLAREASWIVHVLHILDEINHYRAGYRTL